VSAGTPVTAAPASSVQGSTLAAYSAKPQVALAMNASLTRPAWMISLAMVLESAMSDPTSIPSHLSAHCAEGVRLGSTT
jgi:hypothetical protein